MERSSLNRRDALKLALGGMLLVITGCETAPPQPAAAPEAASTQETPQPTSVEAALSGDPVLTKAEDFYVTNYNTTPEVDIASWRLKIDGMVTNKMELSFDQLTQRPQRSEERTIECIGNPRGGEQIGNALWTATSLRDLIDEAKLSPQASFVRFHGADEYETTVPLEAAMHPDSLLIYKMNGEPLTKEHGYPARILMPGFYGQKNPKWVTFIILTDKLLPGFWEAQGWSQEATIKVNSRIDYPVTGTKLNRGTIIIRGIAFNGAAGLKKLDISTDAGETWQPATLKRGPSNYVWTHWAYKWTPEAGSYTILARGEDNDGKVQTSTTGFFGNSFPNGTSEMDQVIVKIT